MNEEHIKYKGAKHQCGMCDVKLSRRLKLIKSSRADSSVNSLKSNVSGTVSVPIIRAMMSAREDFINQCGSSLSSGMDCSFTVFLYKLRLQSVKLYTYLYFLLALAFVSLWPHTESHFRN
jgi:hypothetical protein